MRTKYLGRTARAAVYIHMDRLLHNLRAMKEILPGKTRILAVLKANGYGHGASAIAHVLENEDAVWGYALATAEEAIALRDAGIRKPLMILGYTWEYAYESLIEREIRMAVFREDTLDQLTAAGARVGRNALVHIAVDTGMSRIGIRPDASGTAFVKKAWAAKGIEVEGLFTHFARADEKDLTSAKEQVSRFEQFAETLRNDGMDIPLVHCDNSAGMLVLSHHTKDLVRAGITMYGLKPSDEIDLHRIDLQPVMEFKSHVVCVKTIPAGTPVSYGGTWVADRPTKIATIPVGYADGYPRSLSGKGEVLIRGKRARIVGRVCMDQMMVDVTEIPDASADDEVTLIGRDGSDGITAEELGEKSGRFNYELVCDISERVPRVVLNS
ncbi:MAG: alanine racemase [Lachnospiraceae bacterium]|nr:alanine racemase [Lachnospiraceae bacterium]